MESRNRQIVFVDPEALGHFESHLRALVQQGRVSAAALVDRTGAILSYAGDLPLPEEQMGATAAGVFSALSSIIPGMDRKEFVVQMLTNQVLFRFTEVDERLFVCVFCLVAREDKQLDAALTNLVKEARALLADHATRKPSSHSLQAISEKLNELFSSCKKSL